MAESNDAVIIPTFAICLNVSSLKASSGTIGSNGSGDIFLAFSTQPVTGPGAKKPLNKIEYLSHQALDPIFAAVVQAVDEAVIDSIVTNTDLTGRDDITAIGIPHDALRKLLSNGS